MWPKYPLIEEPISAAAPVTAEMVRPARSVPTYGPGGAFSIVAYTRIAASPLTCLNLVRDLSSYPRWNSFCPHGRITPQQKHYASSEKEEIIREETECFGGGTEAEGWLLKDTPFAIDVFLNGDGFVPGVKRSRVQPLCVTVLERIDDEVDGVKRSGYRLAFKTTGWGKKSLYSERVFEFVEREEGGTDYCNWETFGGIVAGLVKRVAGHTLVDRFGDYARDLKIFLEKGEVGQYSRGKEEGFVRRSSF